MKKTKKASGKRAKNSRTMRKVKRSASRKIAKAVKAQPIRAAIPKSTRKVSPAVTLPARISIEGAKQVAPTVSERNMAFKTLHMIYQNTEFSGDENKVFQNFLERYHESGMKKEELFDFLRSNPAIRRKLWESDVFE
jgi:hypothetical protein